MPTLLIDAVQGDPVADRWAGFGAAMAYARAGIGVIPTMPGAKVPLIAGPFLHGAKDATTDVEAVREHWLREPESNVGTAPDGAFVVVDIDPRRGGSLEGVEALGLDVSGYREVSGGGGHHLPLVMPPGVQATRSATIAPGIELIARGRYAVSPASVLADGGAYRPEQGRSVWTWGAIPTNWQYLDRISDRAPAAALRIAREDERDAAEVVRRLLASAYADDVRGVIADGRGRFLSRSEADHMLALGAAHFLRDHERRAEVVAAVLLRHSRKAADRRDPGDYIARTVLAALAGRDARDTDRLASVRERLRAGLPDHGSPVPDGTNVLDVTLTGIGAVKAVKAWLCGGEPGDAWARENGWCRLPVSDLAAVVGLARESISRAVASLAKAGEIDRETLTYRHDGGIRRDCLIRLRDPP